MINSNKRKSSIFRNGNISDDKDPPTKKRVLSNESGEDINDEKKTQTPTGSNVLARTISAIGEEVQSEKSENHSISEYKMTLRRREPSNQLLSIKQISASDNSSCSELPPPPQPSSRVIKRKGSESADLISIDTSPSSSSTINDYPVKHNGGKVCVEEEEEDETYQVKKKNSSMMARLGRLLRFLLYTVFLSLAVFLILDIHTMELENIKQKHTIKIKQRAHERDEFKRSYKDSQIKLKSATKKLNLVTLNAEDCKKKNMDLEENISSSTLSSTNLSKQLVSTQAELGRLTTERGIMEKDLNEMDDQLVELITVKENMEEDLNAKQEEIVLLTDTNKAAEARIGNLTTQVDNLSDENKYLDEQETKMQMENDDLATKNANFEDDRKTMENDIVYITQENNKAGSLIKELRGSIGLKEERISKLEDSLNELQKKYSKDKVFYQNTQSELGEEKQKMLELKREMDELVMEKYELLDLEKKSKAKLADFKTYLEQVYERVIKIEANYTEEMALKDSRIEALGMEKYELLDSEKKSKAKIAELNNYVEKLHEKVTKLETKLKEEAALKHSKIEALVVEKNELIDAVKKSKTHIAELETAVKDNKSIRSLLEEEKSQFESKISAMVVQKYELVESEKSANARIVQLESSLAHLGDSNEENVQTKGNASKEKETEMEKQIESLSSEEDALIEEEDSLNRRIGELEASLSDVIEDRNSLQAKYEEENVRFKLGEYEQKFTRMRSEIRDRESELNSSLADLKEEKKSLLSSIKFTQLLLIGIENLVLSRIDEKESVQNLLIELKNSVASGDEDSTLQERIDETNEKYSLLESQCLSATQDKRTAEDLINKSKTSLQNIDISIRSMQAALTKNQEALIEPENSFVSLIDEKENAESLVAEPKTNFKETQGLEARITFLIDEKETSLNRIVKLETALRNANEDMESLQAAYNKAKKTVYKDIQSKQSQIIDLEGQIASLTDEKEYAKSRLFELDTSIKIPKEDRKELTSKYEEEISLVKAKLVKAQKTIENLGTQISVLVDEKGILQSLITELDTSLVAANESKEAMNIANENEKLHYETVQAALIETQERLKGQISSLTHERERADSRIVDLGISLQAVEAEKKKTTEKEFLLREEIETKLDQAQKTILQFEEQLGQSGKKDEYQLQIEHLEKIIQKRETTIEEILNLNSELTQEKTALIQDMENLKNEAILALTAVTSSVASQKNQEN